MKTSPKQVLIIEPSRFMRKLLEIHLSIEGHSGLTKEESTHRAIQKAVQATSAVIFILPFVIQDVLALCNHERLSQPSGVPTS